MNIARLENTLTQFLRSNSNKLSRLALFLIYFWFGFIKVLDISPASPLARALVDKTIGDSLFHPMFIGLAVIECIIGLLFLFPRYTRVAFYALVAHMAIVCAPLVLVTNLTWQSPFVPTLEGQYIIKNVALVALAVTLFVATKSPAKKRS